MRRLILLFIFVLCANVSQAQTTTFTPLCAGTNDTARFTAIITGASANNPRTIRVPKKPAATRCALSTTITFPSYITLDFTDGDINQVAGITIQGPIIAPPKQIFFGTGTVSFTGNASIKEVYPQWWGAKGDGVVATVSMTNGLATVTATTPIFTSTAVDAGKLVDVNGAGPTMAGNARYYGTVPPTDIVQNLVGTIVSVTDSTHAVLSVAASQTVSDKQIVFGTNDQAAIQAAISSSAKVIHFLRGKYAVKATAPGTASTGALAIAYGTTGMTLKGDGPWASEIYAIGPRAYDTASTFHLLNVLNGCSGILFKDLGFSGTNANGELTSFGVDIADGVLFFSGAVNSFGVTQPTGNISDIKVDNCRFDHFWGIGFHAPGTGTTAGQRLTNFSIINSWSQWNSYDGLNPNIYDGLNVVGNYLLYNGTGGLETSTYGSMVVANNFMQFNRLVGAAIGGFGGASFNKESLITGNVFSDNGSDNTYTGQGLIVSTLRNFSITGNTAQRNSGIGIQLLGTAIAHSGLVSANIVGNNGLTGAATSMGIYNTMDQVTISGNLVYNENITGYVQSQGIQVAFCDSPHVINNHPYGHTDADYVLNTSTNVFFVDPNPLVTFNSLATSTFVFPAPGPETALTVTGTTIAPTGQFHSVGAGFSTISLPLGVTNGAVIHIRPTTAFTTDLTGNVGLASTAVVGRTMDFTYSGVAGKWYPSY